MANEKYAPTLEGWKYYTDKIKGLINDIDVTLLTPITYSELKSKRDNGNLTPGAQYRITDYSCTTTQDNTQSAGHVFDIIVTADSESVLNENARAIQHDGDTYFEDCHLEGWELKYCLDNDSNRFAWTDDNGKGVIYYMKDEYNNECPYDFKNIQFKRWKISDTTTTSTSLVDTYSAYSTSMDKFTIDSDDFVWCYTFDNKCGGNHTDRSVAQIDGYWCQDNIIKEYTYWEGLRICLNNIVFWNTDISGYDCYSNHFDTMCYNMTFDYDCYQNTFGYGCDSNTFGNDCCQNTFGNYCYQNTFGINCASNTFGNYCRYNTFGNYCKYNKFGDKCNYNKLGNYCECNIFGDKCGINASGSSSTATGNILGAYSFDNTFGEHCFANQLKNDATTPSESTACARNTFGNFCSSHIWSYGCKNNSLGNYCFSNNFGNTTSNNSFGNGCYNNTLGVDCQSNSFGNSCYYNVLGDYSHSNAFGDRCGSDDSGTTSTALGNILGQYSFNNTFGEQCYSNKLNSNNTSTTGCRNNSFGNHCYSNTFGYNCINNNLGHNCYSNTLGTGCSYNSMGNFNASNSFGVYSYSNSTGNNCYCIKFNNQCDGNSFGNRCNWIIFGSSASALKGFYQNNIFDNGNQRIYLTTDQTTSTSNVIKNIRVHLGVNNTNDYKTFTLGTDGLNREYETNIVADNSKSVIITSNNTNTSI